MKRRSSGKTLTDAELSTVSATPSRRKRSKPAAAAVDKPDDAALDGNFTSSCPHVDGALNWGAIRKKVLHKPSRWSCQACGLSGDVWACLVCGHIGCSRDLKGHAEKHFKNTGHMLVLMINSKTCHCYACEAWVFNDSPELKQLRDDLDQVQQAGVDPTKTDFIPLDKANTFVARWKRAILARAFSRWKQILKIPREQRLEMKQLEKPEYIAFHNRRRSVRNALLARTRLERPSLQMLPNVTVKPGWAGLRNLGNTCFFNSIIQSLSHVAAFRTFFIDETAWSKMLVEDIHDGYSSAGTQTLSRQSTIECFQQVRQTDVPPLERLCIAKQVHSLLRVLWSGRWAVVTPSALLEAVWKICPRFRNHQQQDAQEFLCNLLDRLHFEMTGSSHVDDKPSIITEVFQGKLLSELKCLNCGTISKTRDPFCDLSTTIPVVCLPRQRRNGEVSCTLLDCLTSFFAVEVLDGKDWHCDKCKSKQNAEKRFSIDSLPQVLVVVLKRFFFTATSRSKISTPVTFPLRGLDLGSFAASAAPGEAVFDLESVIMHHGNGLQSGHYTSYSYDQHSDLWIHHNDARVVSVSEEDLLRPELASCPYILFFKRRPPPASSRRSPRRAKV